MLSLGLHTQANRQPCRPIKLVLYSCGVHMTWKKVDPKKFEGAKFELAPTTRVEAAGELADDFMFEIFDFDAGDYLITDEADLHDYTDVGSSDIEPLWNKITEVYGITSEDSKSTRLVDIFDAISLRANPQ